MTSINSETAGRLLGRDAQLRAQRQLESVRDRFANVQPHTFLNSLVDRVVRENRYVDLQRIRTWHRNNHFYLGNQVGDVDKRTGFWTPAPYDPDNPVHVNNQYGFFVRSVAAQAVRSQAILKLRPRHNDPQLVGATRVADVVQQDWWRRRWKATERQLEWKYAQLTGNYFRLFWWATKSGQMALVPKTEEVNIAGEEEGYQCNECGAFGAASANSGGGLTASAAIMGNPLAPMDSGMCPQCGSEDLEPMGLPGLSVNIVTGHEQVDGGDVMGEPVDPMEIKLHLHARTFETSPYAIRRRLFLQEVLQSHFPWAEMPRGSQSSDVIMMYQRGLEAANGGGTYSILNDSYFDMVEFEEVWLSPELYSFYVTPKEVDGEMGYPPNTAFRELYPNGKYLARIGNQIVQERPEEKSDYFTHGRFDIIPNSVWGRGQDDAVPQNEQLNEMESLWYEILLHHASRKTAYNPLKFDPEDITGSPRDLMALQNPLEDEDPQHFIWEAQGGGAPPDVPAFIQVKQRNMQSMFAAFAAFTGDSEGRGDPATRTAILRDQAVQMHGPSLEIKAECDVRTTEIVLKLYQKHWSGVRFYYTSGQYDDNEGQYFSRADVQGDFITEAVPGSWRPSSEGDRQARTAEAGMWGGLPGGIFNPEIRSQPKLFEFLLEEFGLSFDAGDVGPDYRKQRMEIRKLEDMLPSVLEAFAEMGIPEQLPPGLPMPDGSVSQEPMPHPIVQFLASKIPVEIAEMQQPPVEPDMPPPPKVGIAIDNNEVHILCIKQYLLEDKGMNAHPLIRAALMQHMIEHADAEVMTNQFMTIESIRSQGPAMAVDQANADADAEREVAAKQATDSGKKTEAKKPSGAASAGRRERQLPTRTSGRQEAGASPMKK
ncbi:MAG: hypothetical protein WBV94_21800 [Blastocatellia bacterium]